MSGTSPGEGKTGNMPHQGSAWNPGAHMKAKQMVPAPLHKSGELTLVEKEVSTCSCFTKTEKEGVGSQSPPLSPGTGPEGMRCLHGCRCRHPGESSTATPLYTHTPTPALTPLSTLPLPSSVCLSVHPAPDSMCTTLVGSLWRLR